MYHILNFLRTFAAADVFKKFKLDLINKYSIFTCYKKLIISWASCDILNIDTWNSIWLHVQAKWKSHAFTVSLTLTSKPLFKKKILVVFQDRQPKFSDCLWSEMDE